MHILAFGDPEGILQRRRRTVQKIIEKFSPEYVIFLGDYYSWNLPYYLKLKNYLKSGDFYDLFPEAKIIKDIKNKFNFVFVYGNKDVRPEVLRLRREKERLKPENFYFILDKYGEVEEFFVINGSDILPFPEKTSNPLYKQFEEFDNEIKKLKEKYKVRRLKSIPKEELKKLRNKYKLPFLLLNYSYFYSLRFASRLRTNKEILLTHTPPYLKGEELIEGVYPDEAIYKVLHNGITPADPQDPEAIKENVGNKYISRFILKNNIKLVFCGHIHEGSGIARIRETNTVVINPGSVSAFVNKERIIPYVFVKIYENKIKIFLNSFYLKKEILLDI